jgi:uncharacterized protein (TIGR02147 family)
LGFNPQETEDFCNLVVAADSRSKKKRAAAQARVLTVLDEDGLHRIQEDTFKIISDWYHFAILELITLRDFRSDPTWIARRLGISKALVEGAVGRLRRLDMIKIEDGKIISTGVQLATTNGIPSDSIKKLTLQLLSKATEAVTLQSVQQRDVGTLTVAIHSDHLDEYKKLIRSNRRSLNRLINRHNQAKAPNTVYCFSSQFFALTPGSSND